MEQNKEKSKEELNTPLKKFRAGAITATIWENESEVKGEMKVFKSVNVERSYTDKKGEWKSTSNFRDFDLPKVVLVSNLAYEYLSLTDEDKV